MTPREAHDEARPGDSVIGWSLDREQRKELLLQFPPRFANVVADHVTLKAKVSRGSRLPRDVAAEIVGRIDDGEGVEAMVVAIEGETGRPDGSVYHITWSLGPGRRAKESNDVIARLGWRRFDLPMPIRLSPRRWP